MKEKRLKWRGQKIYEGKERDRRETELGQGKEGGQRSEEEREEEEEDGRTRAKYQREGSAQKEREGPGMSQSLKATIAGV
jgi:hypothetical protein